jgi:hypothetical protein
MPMGSDAPLAETTSLCPTCFERVPGRYVAKEGTVHLERDCPQHGTTSRAVWDSVDHWEWAGDRGPAPDLEELPDLPPPIERALRLEDPQSKGTLISVLEGSRFEIRSLTDHQTALLDMRDRAAERVDYTRLLPAFGSPGKQLLTGIERLEAAIEAAKSSTFP